MSSSPKLNLNQANLWNPIVAIVLVTIGMLPVCVPTVVAEDLYLGTIKPLLKTKCWACHGPLKQESGLRLDSGQLILHGGESGPAVIAGAPTRSLLLERISSHEEFERMPPEGEPLTPRQIEQFKEWILAGAHVPQEEQPQTDPLQHWAFQPLQAFDESALKAIHRDGSVNPIDDFIQRKLELAGLIPSPPAKPRDLLRRLYFTMHGLPPTWEQVQSFEANPSHQNFKAHVEQVLASPRYGERWAQHWLDIVRYADTHGYEVNTPRPNAWPYRDYVINAFNKDKPYDQFIREQIAGDSYQEDAATGFLVAAAVLLPGQIGKDEPSIRLARQDALDEMIVGTSATFLGLTLGCARCHDHKFDPLSAKDYYALQAFFAGVDYGDREVRDENYEKRQAELAALQPQIDSLNNELLKFESLAFVGKTIVIDDEDLDHVTLLKQKNGHGQNPDGSKRGYRDDPGGNEWMPNISRGRYTWWDNHAGEDVFTYNPQVAGEFQLWISWGAHGSGVHTRDARYLLDFDGDLTTHEDQTEIAQVDQYYVDGRKSGQTEKLPLWSSLRNVGIYHFSEQSKLIVRGGDTGTGVTADVILLQEVLSANKKLRKFPALRSPSNYEANTELIPATRAKKVRFTSFATTNNDRYEPCLDELEVFGSDSPGKNLALAEFGVTASASGNFSTSGRHQLKHINDGNYGNEKSWISNEKGKGWVQLDFPDDVEITRIVWGRDRSGKLKDRLPVDYQIEVASEENDWKVVASSDDRLSFETNFDESSLRVRNAVESDEKELKTISNELEQLSKKKKELSQPTLVYAGVFRGPDQTHLLLRGDPEQPLEAVAPAIPELFGEVRLTKDSSEESRRKTLAEWITQPDNPLTARVMANRIWQYHFGTGLVETPSDFGVNGAHPSHPELLDWLAQELLENQWSMKHLQRLILSSRTWQQSNLIHEEAQEIDADCRLLWRFPNRRLEAEVIRDSLLMVSQQLNMKMGGPGFNFFKSRGGLSGFPPVTEFEEDGLRRMIYAHKIRMESVPVFGAFDCPDAGQPAPVRSQSTTAIQALNLFNSPFVAERANVIAEQIKKDYVDPEDQVISSFRQIVLRDPTPVELDSVSRVVSQHGLPTLIRVLLNCNEFLMLP